MINPDQIISDTIEIFTQESLYKRFTAFVSEDNYKKIHRGFLTSTKLKINVQSFLDDIQPYKNDFAQWGKHHAELPRFGIALVNQDGKLKKNDPVNGSLYEWNSLNPEQLLIETDFRVPTKIMDLTCLKSLEIFNGHWCRSNILYWGKNGEFKPHIDTIVPSPWIRLWGTTKTEGLKLRYFNHDLNEMVSCEDIEPGRIYVIDTSMVHDAKTIEGDTYQFFLSVLPSAFNIIEEII